MSEHHPAHGTRDQPAAARSELHVGRLGRVRVRTPVASEAELRRVVDSVVALTGVHEVESDGAHLRAMYDTARIQPPRIRQSPGRARASRSRRRRSARPGLTHPTSRLTPTVDDATRLEVAIRAAREGGRVALEYLGNPVYVKLKDRRDLALGSAERVQDAIINVLRSESRMRRSWQKRGRTTSRCHWMPSGCGLSTRSVVRPTITSACRCTRCASAFARAARFGSGSCTTLHVTSCSRRALAAAHSSTASRSTSTGQAKARTSTTTR